MKRWKRLPAETRLDSALVTRGLARSRNQAQSLIKDGFVEVSGLVAPKSSSLVSDLTEIVITAPRPFVSRGANKLLAAFAAFDLPKLSGRAVVDVGASTGGFTQVALAQSASVVFSVDVGRGQLASELQTDNRVISLEATDARSLTLAFLRDQYSMRNAAELPPIGLVTVDVSFISVTHVLPKLFEHFPEANFVVLVKPQFEVGKQRLGRGGIVSNQSDQRTVLKQVALFSAKLAFTVQDAIVSPIQGVHGNTEFLLWITRQVQVDGQELEPRAPRSFDHLFI